MHDVYAKIEVVEGTVESAAEGAREGGTGTDRRRRDARAVAPFRGPRGVGARHWRDHRRGAGAAPPPISVTDRCLSEPDRVHDGSRPSLHGAGGSRSRTHSHLASGHVRPGVRGAVSAATKLDYLRVAIVVLIVVATCLHEGDLTTTEHDLFVLFNRLPDSLQSLFEVVYGAGALVGRRLPGGRGLPRPSTAAEPRSRPTSRVRRLDGWAPARRDRRWT